MTCDCGRCLKPGPYRPGDCEECWFRHNPGAWTGGLAPAQFISAATAAGVGRADTQARRVCLHLVADAYPATRYPAELVKPCGHKLRRCELYEEVCTIDPRPTAGGPVPRDCLGCEQRGEGFEPRLS